jgi:hypothetical protein
MQSLPKRFTRMVKVMYMFQAGMRTGGVKLCKRIGWKLSPIKEITRYAYTNANPIEYPMMMSLAI